MKRIFKLTYAALVAVMTMAVSSCTNDYDYDGVTAEGEQVYFSNELDESIELSATENMVNIPIKRVNTSGELTVQLDATIPDGANYTIPTQVTFADGANEANIALGYDPSNIDYGKYDEITIAVADAAYTTPYGASSYTFNIGLTEWKTKSTSNGSGIFRDGIMSKLYETDVLTYDVEIQESVLEPGKYRLVSPYGAGTKFYDTYIDGSTFTWNGGDNTDIVVDATDPDFVYITGTFQPGTADSDGEVVSVMSYVDYYLANGYSIDQVKAGAPGIFGTLKDGVITFPEGTILAYFGSISTGLYYANNDQLAIALPGYALTDYSSSYAYTGRFTDTANQEYAIGTITLGTDVATAKYVVAADGDDVDAIVEGIQAGTVEATEISSSCEVKTQLTESGKYVMIIVTYDADGTMRSYSATTFTFKTSGDAGKAADWQALYTGTFTYNYYPAFITDSEGNVVGSIYEGSNDAVLYVDAANEGTYKIAPWANSEDGLVFTMDDNGEITFTDIDTGDTYDDYGVIYASDAHTLVSSITDVTSYYSEGVFYFGTIYYVSAGYVGGSYETFTITGQASSAPAKVKGIESKLRKALKMRDCKIVKPILKKVKQPKKL